jgi:hypothetical protein
VLLVPVDSVFRNKNVFPPFSGLFDKKAEPPLLSIKVVFVCPMSSGSSQDC